MVFVGVRQRGCWGLLRRGWGVGVLGGRGR